MAGPSVTYTFVNAAVSDASQVNQNFTDLVNGATDGTKDYNINALTAAGTATLNGNVILGNAASDTIAANGYVSTNLTIKSTDATATAGPDIIIDRDSASAADSDAIGRIIFRGNDDAGTPADNDYASIEASIVDSGAGSEDGKLVFKVTEAGTATSYLTIESTKGVAIKGKTDGVAVAAGNVGELVVATSRTFTAGAVPTSIGSDLPSFTLKKGIYLCNLSMLFLGNNTANYMAFGLTTDWSSVTANRVAFADGAIGTAYTDLQNASAGDSNTVPSLLYYLNVSVDDTKYYAWAVAEDNNTSVTIRGAAVRIA